MTSAGSFLDDDMRTRLAALYGAADRHYHGMSHIEDLLALAHEHADLVDDADALEAAIWFHDAILDTRRNDNETLSARLAGEWLAGRATAQRVDAVMAMIEATATHVIPDRASPSVRNDISAFLDMDLSILGASPERFDDYEAAVRKEYDWVEDDAWRQGRAQVLQRFLGRPVIYSTPRFRGLLEEAARANIARSLSKLA
ncbi:hypothetical protein [Mesorhizobium sp. CAU 1732]|uniref:HD domain-containing protein n=1 Tax=Mesorhizobium sp. CAU 1732 TaxID=3140358 RepID=UPI003261BD13